MSRIECTITGRVQMVMYRDFAQRKASRLGVSGTVKNLADGSVFVVAEGEKKVLEKYTELLKVGSILSHVDDVSVMWKDSTGEFIGFKILYQ